MYSGVTDAARRVTDAVNLLDDKLQRTQSKVDNVTDKIDNNLWPKYREIRDFSVDDYITDTKNSSKNDEQQSKLWFGTPLLT